MKRDIKEIAGELLRCAEELSQAVVERELASVESLLARREQLLDEMRSVEVPVDDEARLALESVRELDLRSGEGLSAMRSEVADELGRVRSARRSGRDAQERTRSSHFVSTRC